MSASSASGAVVGDAMWDRQGRRTHSHRADYPGAVRRLSARRQRQRGAARALTTFFSNDCIDFEVQLVLERDEVPAVELDLNAATPGASGLGVVGQDSTNGQSIRTTRFWLCEVERWD